MATTTQQLSQLLDAMIERYKEGGEYGKAEKALLERAKIKAMATVGQQLASAGLAGTTVGAGASQRWQEEIGMPAELQLENIRSERLTQAMAAKAGFLQEEAARQQALAFQKLQLGTQTGLAREQMAQQERLAQQQMALSAGGGGGGIAADNIMTHNVPDFSIPETTGTTQAGTRTGSMWYYDLFGNLQYGVPKGENWVAAKTTDRGVPVGGALPEEGKAGYAKYVGQVGQGVETATPSQFTIINQRLREKYGVSPAGAYY